MEMQRRQLTPEQDALEHIAAYRDKPFLEERFIDSFKGRGVFTHKTVEPSTFVVEYRGKIFGHKNKRPRRKCGDTLNNYLYEFSWKGARWCIDASKEDKTLGRLVNDDHINPNCEMKKIEYEGSPHLCLFAVKEISPGEEITYNYGDFSYPWRTRESSEESSASDTDFHTTSSTPRNKKLEESSSDDGEPSDGGPSSEENYSDEDYKPHEDSLSSDEQGSDDDCSANEDTQKPKSSSDTIRNYCYVCGNSMTKVARHLLRHADEEPDIAKVFALPKKSQERKRLLTDLRNRGNYKHSQEVLRTNSGDLKPGGHPTITPLDAKTSARCLYCKGMFRDMRRHVARCTKKTSKSAKPETDEKHPPGVQKMLLKMKRDEIAFVIKSDKLLIQQAQYVSEKYADNLKKQQHFRRRLRQMGRLLLTLHEKSIFSFEDAIKPKNFSKVVETVKSIAGFDEKRRRYKKPTLALKLGQSLKQIANTVLNGTADNEEMVRDTKTFLKLCTEQWCELVSRRAYSLLNRQQVKSPSTIPFTHDVQAFYRCLETTSASAIETMKMYESPQVYNALCRVTLAQVSVLNKGAPEVSKMTLKSFQEREGTTQVLSKHFIRINTPNITGEDVAVLLTSELVSVITKLVSKRMSCGVHKDNLFLFAKPDGSASSVYSGRGCISSFSKLCRAKNPEYLRSTYFQKHITRVFQILNLENDELSHLAKLLGLDIRTERDYYRLPEAAEELAKIAKLLLAMEKGSLERFKGNSLDEIEIEDQLEPDVEQANSKNDDSEKDKEVSAVLPQQSEQQVNQPTPEQDALEHIKACKDKPFLEGIFIDPFKGRGVFTHEAIEPSTFVTEYRGNIFTREESQKNKCGDTLNNYVFDFSWNGTNWCIDASEKDGTLGRLVNDDHISPNCEMKKVVFEGKPHLCLFALKKIFAGEEITYNYGDSSYPWRSTESSERQIKSHEDLNAAASSPRNEKGVDSSYAESVCDDPGDVPDNDLGSDEDFTSDNNQQCQQEDDAHPDEKPSYTNRNYCFVCGKAQTKMARHLFTHRNEDAEIAEVFALRRNSKERKSRLEKLRNRGNCKHNGEVLKTRHGELKVRKRHSNMATTATVFAPCIYCKVMYCRKTMWLHLKKCSLKNFSKPPTSVSTKVLTLVAATSTDPQEMSSDLREMVKTLKEDEVASVVLKDSYILQLAQCLCDGSKGKTKRYKYVRVKLRQMGRLLLILQEKSVCSFEEAMKPKNYGKLVEAVRELTGVNEERKCCHRPSLLLQLVKSLKLIGGIKYARAVKEDADKETIQEAEKFLALCAKEWSGFTLSNLNENGAATIPFTRDVQLVYQHMEKTAASAVKTLTVYESPPVYNALVRVTLAQISVLNKNVCDISKVTLQSFMERQETELHEDAAVCQSQFEQILRKRFVKIQVTSRSAKKHRGKKVAVMLTAELLSAITLLVNKRQACGVQKNNPFLFARPDVKCTSFYRGQKCVNCLVDCSGAEAPHKVRSLFLRKHMARIFHILSLSVDELDQLSRLLERDIRTDVEYYQMPEAAVDIAKILQLLSAMEMGSTERYEGKSLEEIEVEDELQPHMEEEDDPESSDGEEDDVEAQSSLQPSDDENGTNVVQDKATTSKGLTKAPNIAKSLSFSKDSSSLTKKRVLPARKRGRGRRRKQESESGESELSDEKNDEVTTEQDRTEDTPVKCAEETSSHSKEHEASICFSDDDDDDDMHVDFDVDIDTDEDVRNDESAKDGDSVGSTATPMMTDVKETTNNGNKEENSPDGQTTDLEDTMDTDTENYVDKKDQEKGGEQADSMDVDSSRSSAVLNTEKNRLSAGVTGMKEVKIFIPKLDIEKVKAPIHISQLPSLFNKWPVKDQLTQNNNKCKASTSTDISDEPSDAKDIEMTCSHCKTIMMKGQTAYQKKGFKDVFCSKNCLFEMFPINKPAAMTCHYCLKGITQLLDVIMAVVDIKGTMKGFCSVTCLVSFKSNTVFTKTQQSLCSTCNKSCCTTCEVTLNEVVHKIYSDSCLEGFRKDSVVVCENCSSPCHSKLMLKLEEDDRTFCSEGCVEKYKENIKTPHPCTMCHSSVPVSRMVVYKSGEDTVELFCDRPCVTSFKLCAAVTHKVQGKIASDHLKKKQDKQPKQNSDVEDVNVRVDSTVNESDAAPAAASDTTPTLSIASISVWCCHCGKKLPEGATIYQLKSSQEVFCSASCVSEWQGHTTVVLKSCYNCFQVIKRPQNIISAPVDDSGTMKELCSETCLASVQSKRSTAASKPPPPPGSRSECRMCVRYCYCKFKLTLDGVVHRLCSDACFISYSKINNLPLLMCDICSSFDLDRRLVLKVQDGPDSKNICSEECLVKFKQKVKTPRVCSMCQTLHQMSDMVENKNEDGNLNFFCSNRCMMVYTAPSFTVSEWRKATHQENDIKEVKPSLPNVDCPKVKEEPIDDDNKQNFLPSVSTQDIKDEPNVVKEDMKIGSVFSFTGDPTPAPPPLTHTELPACCSCCKEVLVNRETVYQRKDHTDVFCSTSCLLKFYQIKPVKKTCHFCLEVITQSQDSIQAVLDNEETVKDFCSQNCLSSFYYKAYVSTKIPIIPVGSHSQCGVCGRYCISKHEVIEQGVVHKACSDSCFRRFCNMNKFSICENCQSHCSTLIILKTEDGNKKLCSAKCLAQFKQKVQPQQPCGMCRTSKLVLEIVENQNSDGVLELICTSSCVKASEIQAAGSSESSPPGPSGTVESFPVIANIMSFASTLTRNPSVSSSTAQLGSLPAIQTKVVGHAGTQTAPKEVKNKSMLCTPLVHNKGVSCTTQTVDTEAQTDNVAPKVIVVALPVPVPVYVPLPMNMYSQYTPKPVGLPLPLPVPMFVPVRSGSRSPASASAPPLLEQSLRKVHNKNKGRKLQVLSKAAKEDRAQKDTSKVTSRRQHELNSQRGIGVWKRWIQWRKSQTKSDPGSSHAEKLKENILHCSAAELNSSLSRFIREVKRSNGKSYSPDSLFYLCLSIQQHLFENGRMENIFSDLIYSKFSTQFTKILKRFKPSVRDGGYIHSRVEEEYLWDCKQLGAYSPIVLLNTLIFFCCKYFGFTTVEQHRQLSFSQIIRFTKNNPNNTKTEYLRFYSPVSMNEAESDTDGVPAKKRKKRVFLEMMENTDNPIRCPVRLYEFYISKCGELVRKRSDLFYLQPDRCCVPGSPLWFSSSPLDDGTMEAVLARTLTVREVQGQH